MRVAMYYNNNDVRLEELPKPTISDDEILVKVKASGICGSDVLEWYRIKKAPLVLGHEISADIVEVGNNVKDYSVGQRVFVSHHVPCNDCRYCNRDNHTACETLHTTNFHPGGFSEFIQVPKINVEHGVFVLPNKMTYDEGTFIEPLGCVVRGQRIADVKKGQTVLVLGSGIAGLLHIQLAKMKGAKVIATDISKYRLDAAKRFGADNIMDAKGDVANEVLKANGDKLADRVIVCTGAIPAVRQAIDCVDKGGTVLFFAVPMPDNKLDFPLAQIWRNEITLKTSYAASPDDLKEAIELIETQKVNVTDMITHRLGLEETGKGFKLVAEAKDSLKVIIEPHK